VNRRPAIGFPFGNGKSHSHRRLGKGAERFYYIFFVMLHESLKVGTKAKDEDVDKIDR